MKKGIGGKSVYFILCILAELAALLFFALSFFTAPTRTDRLVSAWFLVTAGLIAAISVIAWLRCLKGRGGNPVRNALLMKPSVFFIGLAVSFLALHDGIYAFFTFLIPGLLLSAVTLRVIKGKRRVKRAPRQKQPAAYTLRYKGEWAWDQAAAEYRRLHGLAGGSSLTEEQNRQIYDYTVTPLSYLFYWLADSGFLSRSFYDEYPEEDLQEGLLRHRCTPVDVLRDLDYYFGSEYLSDDIIPFFRRYYDMERWFPSRDAYLYDYYDAIGNPEDRYYCVDFSWDVLKRLTAKIQARYDESRAPFAEPAGEFHDDEPLPETIHSVQFDADLQAYTIGVKRGGFPNGDARGYLAQCAAALDSLSDTQILRLESFFDDVYGVEETPEATSIRSFHPDAIHIFEPLVPGDVTFAVSGEADFEPEHGISFVVRNGLILSWDYACDIDDPYSAGNLKVYESLSPIPFAELCTAADAERCLRSGELVRVKLLPDIPHCTSASPEEYVYLTPRALEDKKKYEQYIRNIRAYTGMSDLELVYEPRYLQRRDRPVVSVVPQTLDIHCADDRIGTKIFFSVRVW